MNAKEMFKQLGYEFEKEYNSDGVNDTYRYNKCSRPNDSVIFYLDGKQIIIYQTFNTIHVSELQAITQQCKELGWFEEEKKEIKQETNFEHYKDEIVQNVKYKLAVVNGEPKPCEDTNCDECDFNNCDCCGEKRFEWLASPYKKPTYKLSQFEFDIIQTYRDCHESCKFSEFKQLIELKDKGYFQCVDDNTNIQDVLKNCEVIK